MLGAKQVAIPPDLHLLFIHILFLGGVILFAVNIQPDSLVYVYITKGCQDLPLFLLTSRSFGFLRVSFCVLVSLTWPFLV